jgi:hypothetical protein
MSDLQMVLRSDVTPMNQLLDLADGAKLCLSRDFPRFPHRDVITLNRSSPNDEPRSDVGACRSSRSRGIQNKRLRAGREARAQAEFSLPEPGGTKLLQAGYAQAGSP